MKLYSTTNPQAIINMFEIQAKAAEGAATHKSVRQRDLFKREAVTWRAAADILRNTEFVGWNVGMIVDDVRERTEFEMRFKGPKPE